MLRKMGLLSGPTPDGPVVPIDRVTSTTTAVIITSSAASETVTVRPRDVPPRGSSGRVGGE